MDCRARPAAEPGAYLSEQEPEEAIAVSCRQRAPNGPDTRLCNVMLGRKARGRGRFSLVSRRVMRIRERGGRLLLQDAIDRETIWS